MSPFIKNSPEKWANDLNESLKRAQKLTTVQQIINEGANAQLAVINHSRVITSMGQTLQLNKVFDVEGSGERQEPADNRQAKFIPHRTADAHLLVWRRIHLHEAASSVTRSSMLRGGEG